MICAMYAGTSGAQAQQPGVHIDPGGPAGREYQLPTAGALDQTGAQAPSAPANGTGATGKPAPSAPAGDSRRFGVGVGPAAGAESHGSAGDRAPTSAQDGPSRAAAAPAVKPPSFAQLERGGAGSSLWLVPAIAVAVLAAAGGLAVALRCGRRG
jgi:hypothetical protein